MEENVRALNATYERALLLDSKNLKAKLMLAYGLVGDREPANRQRGKDMLREVIASGDSRFVQRAQWSLDLTDPMLRKRAVEWLGSPSDILKARGAKLLSELGPPDEKEAELERKMHQTAVDNSKRWHAEQERAERERTLVSQNGGSQLAGSPAPNAPSRTAATAAASAALPPQTNAPRAGMLVEIPAPRSMGSTFPMTAVNGGGPLLASGILLYCYNKYVNRLEPMDLPITLKHPITAIESDKLSIWLGTDGGGLAQIDRGGGPCRIYTEKDGLLMPSITVLARTGDRLWIGFGSRERGGIGYLELPAGRFVGLTNDVGLFKSPEERLQAPPDAAIQFIRSLDNKVFWIGTRAALHRFDTESRKWSTALPFAPNGLSLGLNCVAVGGPRGGVMVCKLPGDRWEQIDIDRSPELVENKVFSLRALDNSLWVGGDGKLSLIDLRTLRVVGQRKLADCREVRSILLFEKSVVFVADRMRDVGGSEMYWFPSPSLP